MHNIIKAIQQLLEASQSVITSPLYDVKKIIYGDPKKIPQNLLPAITIEPADIGFKKRGSRYDEKQNQIIIRLVYNREVIFNSNLETKKTITSASYSSGKITFGVTGHGYSLGDNLQSIGNIPSGYNGAFEITDIVGVDSFKVAVSSDPGSIVTKGTTQKAIVDKVMAVEDAILKAGGEDSNHSTDKYSICGVIQHNPSLPLTVSGVTSNTCEFANVTNVHFDFNNKERPFSTFEVIFTVEVTTLGDR